MDFIDVLANTLIWQLILQYVTGPAKIGYICYTKFGLIFDT